MSSNIANYQLTKKNGIPGHWTGRIVSSPFLFYIPRGYGGSLQYCIFTSGWGRNFLLILNLNTVSRELTLISVVTGYSLNHNIPVLPANDVANFFTTIYCCVIVKECSAPFDPNVTAEPLWKWNGSVCSSIFKAIGWSTYIINYSHPSGNAGKCRVTVVSLFERLVQQWANSMPTSHIDVVIYVLNGET